ncbi:MAG: hypothetical protein NTY19_45090 [Planctomycetota bacterium]|nr:hypothetical protein [Planctomycetota bacterium]
MREPIAAAIRSFAGAHPGLNADLFEEYARVALSRFHEPPAAFTFCVGDASYPACVEFDLPDPRSEASLERERFVELGAIVLAGLLLQAFENKQITRVVGRGSRVDYFVGEDSGDFRWMLEVGGTDQRSFEVLRRTKRQQFEQSPYRQAPHYKDGFVSVTRFAPSAASSCDSVPAK